MSIKKRIAAVLLVLPLFVFFSSGEQEESGGSLAFIGKVINFLILFGGLGYVLYKPVRAFLEKNASDIERTLSNAASFRKDSEARSEISKVRLAGLSAEIKSLKAEAEEQGRREKARISGLADDEARKIKTLTRQEIEMQAQTGIRDLKLFLAGTATTLARERIRKSLAPEDQVRLIDKSIERLSRLNEKSTAG